MKDTETIDRIFVVLDESFTKNELQNGWLPMVIKFEVANFGTLRNEAPKECLRPLPKGYNKASLLMKCLLPFFSKKLFQKFLACQTEQKRSLIEDLILVTHKPMKEIDFAADKYDQRYYYSRSELLKGYQFCKIKNLDSGFPRKNNYVVYFPIEFRRLVIDYLLEEEKEWGFLDEIPKTTYLKVHSDEYFLANYPILKAYFEQGSVKISAKNRPNKSSIPKMAKTLQIEEFFPNNMPKHFINLKTYFIASFFAMTGVHLKNGDLLVNLRNIWVELLAFENDFPCTIFYYLNGINRIKSYYAKSYVKELTPYFKALSTEGWLSFDDFYSKVFRNLLELNIFDFHYGTDLYYEKENIWNDVPLSKMSNEKTIVRPYVAGLCFFFSALGILDIAYDDPKDTTKFGKTYYSMYDNLKYIRLTALGSYLLGQTDSYSASTFKMKKQEYSLSENSLFITLKYGNKASEITLSQFARPISSKIFVLDNTIFFQNIGSKKDLHEKVKEFKNLVGKEKLPAFWNQHFKKLENRIHPLVSQPNFYVYQVPSDNEELQSTLLYDEVLKKIVQKAENYRILVDAKDTKKFALRMKELGYLL